MNADKDRLKGRLSALRDHKAAHPYQLHEKTRDIPLSEVQREFLEWVEANIQTAEHTSWLHPKHGDSLKPWNNSEAKKRSQDQ